MRMRRVTRYVPPRIQVLVGVVANPDVGVQRTGVLEL